MGDAHDRNVELVVVGEADDRRALVDPSAFEERADEEPASVDFIGRQRRSRDASARPTTRVLRSIEQVE